VTHPRVIVDTGPLVALFARRDSFHAWAADCFRSVPAPAVTCEAVLTEALFLLRKTSDGQKNLFEALRRGAIVEAFRAGEHLDRIDALMTRYAEVPMAFADACIVRMAETIPNAQVLTLDADFHVYRRHGRLVVPLFRPVPR
jgi:predicted nucleic acid-binding protein